MVLTYNHGIVMLLARTHGIEMDSWYGSESHMYKRAECCPYAGLLLFYFFYRLYPYGLNEIKNQREITLLVLMLCQCTMEVFKRFLFCKVLDFAKTGIKEKLAYYVHPV